MSSFVALLSFALLFNIVIAVDPLNNFCSTNSNFTTLSLYRKNLDKVLGDLYFKTIPNGFGLSSSGQFAQDRVYGLSLCRGDISAQDCLSCVVDASSEILKRCPYDKEAVIYYDNCLLKYSDTDFFGKIDDQHTFYLLNVNSVNNTTSFNMETRGLLSLLSEEAMVAPKLYASGECEVEGDQKIYGSVQCTRDLSGADCKKCLDDAVSQLPSCCDGKEGGRVVGVVILDMRFILSQINMLKEDSIHIHTYRFVKFVFIVGFVGTIFSYVSLIKDLYLIYSQV